MIARSRSPRPPEDLARRRSGLLVVDKPTGVTSHDVVDRVRRRLRVRRAGHLGTLDPGATGLLLVAIGAATRCAQALQGGEKTYEGELRLGVATSTQDLSGEVIAQRPVRVDEAAVRAAARSMVGEFDQIPPMVSAIRLGGERLYRMARRGRVVERPPRRVRVSAWEWLGFDLPSASFRVRCSGGTYVRTLAHDLGERLGTGAALASLRRLRSEPFGLERSVSWRDLETLPPDAVWSRGAVELEEALAWLPSVSLDAAGATAIGHGSPVPVARDAVRAGRSQDPSPASEQARATRPAGPTVEPTRCGPRSIVFLGPEGEPLGLGELEPDPSSGGLLARPHLVFPWAVRVGRP